LEVVDVEFEAWKEVDLLALLIWSEARGEPVQGQIAVAHVVLNRRRIVRWYGSTVHKVILKPWQFSWFNPFTTGQGVRPTIPRIGASFQELAARVLAGDVPDPTGGATHFHATWMPVPPAWAEAMTVLCQIGQHRFYKER